MDLLDEKDTVGTTISGANDEIEPNSESTEARLIALKDIKEQIGCEVFVSCEPVFNPYVIYDILESIDFIDKFKVGKTNYVECLIKDWKEFGENVIKIAEKNNRNIFIKKSLREEIGI